MKLSALEPWVRFAIPLSLFAGVLSASGESNLYRWTDDQGRQQFTDTPPPASCQSKSCKEIRDALSSGRSNQQAQQAAHERLTEAELDALPRSDPRFSPKVCGLRVGMSVNDVRGVFPRTVFTGSKYSVPEGSIGTGFEQLYVDATSKYGAHLEGTLSPSNKVASVVCLIPDEHLKATFAGKTLREKYGKPTTEYDSNRQNQFGAVFSTTTQMWKFPNGVELTYNSPARRMDRGIFRLDSAEDVQQRRAAPPPKPIGGF